MFGARSKSRSLWLFPWLLCWALTACAGSQTGDKNTGRAPAQQKTHGAFGDLYPGEPETALPVEHDDIVLGSPNASVTLVAFLDFECHFCRRGFATLEELRGAYSSEDLRIVVKHLPLDFHPGALPAAAAAQAVQLARGSEAAFAFAHKAFDEEGQLDVVRIADMAEEVGLDRARYNDLLADPLTTKRVAGDVFLARRHGVTGTPTFFVNGRIVVGAYPKQDFDQLIAQELTEIRKLRASLSAPLAYQRRVEENLAGSLAESLLASDPNDYRLPIDGSPSLGPNAAPVTIVVFSDFECPYCKKADTTLREVRALYGDRVRIVFKHHPLPFHHLALPAALLGAAVFEKHGAAAFFQLSDVLFSRTEPLDQSYLEALAARFGVGSPLAASPGLHARIERDLDLADDSLVQGTPHFFINGKRLSGARPLSHFRAIIDSELKRSTALLESGVTPEGLYEALQKDALSPGLPTAMDLSTLPKSALSTEGHPVRGPEKAPVTIHVFSDFECPFCRRAEMLLNELEREHPGQLRFVWHDFPLDFHERAMPAARAAQEAFRQKGSRGFWEMHAALFGLTKESVALSEADLREHAKSLKLDLKSFERALQNELPAAGIEADQELGKQLGISGTPAFLVGNYLIAGLKPKRHFERVIRQLVGAGSEK